MSMVRVQSHFSDPTNLIPSLRYTYLVSRGIYDNRLGIHRRPFIDTTGINYYPNQNTTLYPFFGRSSDEDNLTR